MCIVWGVRMAQQESRASGENDFKRYGAKGYHSRKRDNHETKASLFSLLESGIAQITLHTSASSPTLANYR